MLNQISTPLTLREIQEPSYKGPRVVLLSRINNNRGTTHLLITLLHSLILLTRSLPSLNTLLLMLRLFNRSIRITRNSNTIRRILLRIIHLCPPLQRSIGVLLRILLYRDQQLRPLGLQLRYPLNQLYIVTEVSRVSVYLSGRLLLYQSSPQLHGHLSLFRGWCGRGV